MFKSMLMDYDNFHLKKYKIRMIYNSRLDPSNTITMIKLFEDFLKNHGVIKDDSKKYCKEIRIIPDETMKSKSYRIELYRA